MSATLALGAGSAAAPRQATTASSSISGSVIAIETGLPARQARVTLAAPDGRAIKTTVTDDAGLFAFDALSAGTYLLSVSKLGYLAASYGQRLPGSATAGTPIDLDTGQRLTGLSLRLPRGGAISGAIVDDHGDAAYHAYVTLIRLTGQGPQRKVQESLATLTDERGIYRVGLLPPGQYLVQVAAGREGLMVPVGDATSRILVPVQQSVPMRPGELPLYYPGTLSVAAAQTITIEAGEERTGIDVALQPAAAARIAGFVHLAGGERVSRARLFLVDRDTPLPTTTPLPLPMPMRDDGSFTVPQLAPGRYRLIVRAAIAPPGRGEETTTSRPTPSGSIDGGLFADSSAELWWAESDLVVGTADITDLIITLQKGVTVSGVVSFEGGGAGGDLSRLTLSLVQAGFEGVEATRVSPVPVAVDDTGRFRIAGLAAGEYTWRLTGVPAGWWAKSMIALGRDSLDMPLEVRAGQDVTGAVLALGQRPAEIAGTLTDAAGHPMAGYTVIVFPAQSVLWSSESRRIRVAVTSTDGHYSVRPLPPGEYRLVAVIDVEAGSWFDAKFLAEVSSASLVMAVGDGERKTQDYRIVR